ncbi:DUF3923 family protein [Facklamia sp. DSM 111018]|uniref:DUF3923 family protein n=1 Tax=Facklamia lactis TaxID=2749967 RepID=A0ABS0LUL8_9LACT|nr:DUF3923 family protein [Facklamia lactis]MBG9981202.1 DUF3923 family protein [Facklamia lactis]MBG9987004.1 DUF3923 family protein [Facklamia lactis]
MKNWIRVNIGWLVLFIISSIYIMVREVDSMGTIQTPEMKLCQMMIVIGFFSLVASLRNAWHQKMNVQQTNEV